MDFRGKIMETIAEWFAVANNSNGNLFPPNNGGQRQALPLTTYSDNTQQNNTSEKAAQSVGKTLSIRCVVESVTNTQSWNSSHTNTPNNHIRMEVDRPANIPVHTVFYNVVDIVLQMFGYPREAAITARGSIEIENWKPIRLEKVALNPQKTVNDILGRINSFVTLRIQILKTTSSTNTRFARMKEKLLQWLILHYSEHIQNSGCPLDQLTLKSILRGSDFNNLVPTDEELHKFDQWMTNQLRQTLRPMTFAQPLAQFTYRLGSSGPLHYDKVLSSVNSDERVHPALQTIQNQYPTQKTRMRTSFDQELELPKLQAWFLENQHPTRQQIQQYVNELNNLESRRGRKPLDVNNVVYWFKNARAAQKRGESRKLNTGQLNSVNGYESNSHSPCDIAGISKESVESGESCDDDEMEGDNNRLEEDEKDDSLSTSTTSQRQQRCGSPVAPLSLITHKNNANSTNSSPIPTTKREPSTNDSVEQHRTEFISLDDKKIEPKNSPDRVDYDSDDEDMDDDISDEENAHENDNLEQDSSNTFFPSSTAPLSIIPRPSANSVFPIVPNAIFRHGFPAFGLSPYLTAAGAGINAGRHTMNGGAPPTSLNHSACSPDERRGKRNRTFIDPVTEVPRLEQWFQNNTHPSQNQLLQFTDMLNTMSYRQKFPKLEVKNVQFWFKNRRAKNKRLKVSLYDPLNNNLSPQDSYSQLAVALNVEKYRGHD